MLTVGFIPRLEMSLWDRRAAAQRKFSKPDLCIKIRVVALGRRRIFRGGRGPHGMWRGTVFLGGDGFVEMGVRECGWGGAQGVPHLGGNLRSVAGTPKHQAL